MTCVGAQNVAQFQSTSKQSVTELRKSTKSTNAIVYIYSLFNCSLQHYMQDLGYYTKHQGQEWPGSMGKMFINAGSSPLD